MKEIDAPLTQVFKETYEVTIDKGAHPNVLLLGQHLDFTDWDENNGLENIVLLPEDHLAVKSVLSLCVVVGAAVTSLCTYVMLEHAPAIEARCEAMEVMSLFLALR